MQVVLQILMKLLLSLATEKVIRELVATGLDQITRHTATPVDDEMARPIIAALRGE